MAHASTTRLALRKGRGENRICKVRACTQSAGDASTQMLTLVRLARRLSTRQCCRRARQSSPSRSTASTTRREADTSHSMLHPAPESVRGVAIGWCSCRVRAQKALCYNSQTDSQMPLARSLRINVCSALFAGHGARAQRQLTEMRPDAGCGECDGGRTGVAGGCGLRQ